ncbi:bifunctional diguanylate cyclase/phosphodiesterase [Alteromonas pelagimontana]|uniref:Bifunctional diguanylate cyclase/phosphodiesterase n=1 Tax=Alteromonas pelagimontana TaxID=1858656 RepID=A0A6M4MF08_9ALTE|nr:bifunctional diguanylate cyclase/phosphodiesterase [Alteromonas pelagimontana]QJR81663.1 bifunctional diguanylate cyclase/phosphodiesterase [Alteromonas pelagimontana]
MGKSFSSEIYRLIGWYLLFAFLWILLSDHVASLFFTNINALTEAQTIKGGCFILATTLFLFLLLKRMVRNIEKVALVDTLTLLPNRIAFKREIDARCREAQRNKKQFYVLSVDLEKFSDFNNEHGHEKGDLLLLNLAAGLQREISARYYIARISADEFGIIGALTERGDSSYLHDAALIAKQAEDICTAISPRPIKAHIALATYPENAKDCKGIIRCLDIALNYAKSHPHTAFTEYQESYRVNLFDRLTMVEELIRAIDKKEFSVVYQPQWDFSTNHWHGAEVLVRWYHPTLGVISPIQFIEIAEEEGLIGQITEIVFAKAFAELKKFEIFRTHLSTISFNFSYAIIGNRSCVAVLEKKIEEAMIPQTPEIVIELTETAMVQNVAATKALLERWKTLGVKFSIDDFGTGYTSLSQLQQLPIDEIKIDRSFIAGIPIQPTSNEITKAILAMSQKLEKTVIAEGVETSEQSEFLQANGCQVVQGYLYSKPLDIRQLKAALENPPNLA